MNKRIREFLKQRIEALHRNESGAVMLLLLASFLILFMMAMTLYDTGIAAQDKMDVQIAADASSFSHSVVKSRSMNMISYANIIKRMYFSYAVSYVNGLTALVAVTAAHTALCARMCGPVPCPRLKSCWELVENILLIISELAQAFVNLPSLGLIPGMSGSSAAINEIIALERYQQYMFQITPWWAWVENVTRSMDNGAMVTSAWPPPGSSVETIKGVITRGVGTVDWAIGSSFMNLLPSHTTNVDVLPVTRRDRQTDWSDSIGPFKFEVGNNYTLSAIEYCLSWVGSMEQVVISAQTLAGESKGYEWFNLAFLALQTLGGSVGCALTNFAWYQNAQGAHLDWKLNSGEYTDDNSWLKATSVLTYAYKPRAGRNDNESGRSKLRYMGDRYEYNKSGLTRDVEGYFAVSRSEISYKRALGTGAEGGLGSVLGFLSQIPILGDRLGVQNEPDMWSPRWTARNRPVALPREKLGSATGGTANSGHVGFNTVITDTIPYLVMGSILGIFDPNFSAQSGMKDLIYLYQAGLTMTDTKIEGISK